MPPTETKAYVRRWFAQLEEVIPGRKLADGSQIVSQHFSVYGDGLLPVATTIHNEQDAQLIAAAPEMLEALKLATDTIERLVNCADGSQHAYGYGHAKHLREWIAKVEGR